MSSLIHYYDYHHHWERRKHINDVFVSLTEAKATWKIEGITLVMDLHISVSVFIYRILHLHVLVRTDVIFNDVVSDIISDHIQYR